MHEIHDFLSTLDGLLGGSQWFVYLLLGTGVFFTVYLKFPQIRYFGHAIRVVRGKYDKDHHKGDATHFQALSTALSGTVGTGNIAGVAFAIHLGGPAALFWMLVTAFLGMTTKFVEVTLSHKYRETDSQGFQAGGPMYYMKNKLKWKWIAIFFAIATVVSSFGSGSLPQINSIANAMFSTFGLAHWISGAVLAVILALIIVGGITRIAKVSEMLVPFMGIFYFLGAMLVIGFNYQNIIPSIASIFTDIFSGSSALGGFLGASFAFAFNRGVNRGLFSNESGQGSAPIAHAAARTDEPASEGLVALLEPFIDTIIICFITGMALLTSGTWTQKYDNTFQQADLVVMTRVYEESNADDVNILRNHLNNLQDAPLYTGTLTISEGTLTNELTLLHARSIAENVKFMQDDKPYNGVIHVNNGKVDQAEGQKVVISGKSLLHSAPLTNEAFKRSPLGRYGEWIVTIGLLLFAFSTAISWSYYGDRAITFLVGAQYVIYYRIVYVIAFFTASMVDTTIIWVLSGITIAFMTIPNLFGILFLHKDMKLSIKEYWERFNKEHGTKFK